MKKRSMGIILVGIALCLVLIPVSGFAVPGDGQRGMGHPKGMGHPGKHQFMSKMKGAGHAQKAHIFGPGWKETLTDAQKKSIDVLHLGVKKKVSLLEARLNVQKVELNNTVIKEGASMLELEPLIDAILESKKKIMGIKYSHKIEMRKVLTEEQRVSFDLGLLAKAAKKSRM